MADKQATLDLGDKTQEFPVLEGSVGPDVVDIRKLYGTTGKFTYDPGYKSTASCETKTTASGSSPFTWKTGACTIFATSVQ